MEKKNMSSKKKPVTKNEVTANVVGSTAEDRAQKGEQLSGSDVVTLCVALRGGHKFTDVPDGKGGVKTVYLAGLDDALRGKKGGILTEKGNAIYQTVPRQDWEHIQRMHGDERMFHSWNGLPPCVFEVKSVTEAKRSTTIQDQIKATETGADPLPENYSKDE